VRADSDKHRIKSTLSPFGLEIRDTVVADEPYPQPDDPIDLVVQHVPREPIGRDAVAHHPARLRARVANLDLVAELRQVIGRRQPARATADHQHPLAARRCRRLERPVMLARQIAEESLHRVDRDGAVEVRPITAGFARVVAHPSMDRGKRVVVHEHAPGSLVLSRLHLGKPLLDVLPGRTGRVAGRQEIHVDRALGPNGTPARAPVH
jgi:hypothetical protein